MRRIARYRVSGVRAVATNNHPLTSRILPRRTSWYHKLKGEGREGGAGICGKQFHFLTEGVGEGGMCFTLGRSRVDETLDLYPGGHVERDALGPRDASCARHSFHSILFLLRLGFELCVATQPGFVELFYGGIFRGIVSSSVFYIYIYNGEYLDRVLIEEVSFFSFGLI